MSNVGDTWSTGISRALSVGTQMCVFAQESSVALSGEALDTHFSSSSTLPPRQAPYSTSEWAREETCKEYQSNIIHSSAR